MAALGRYRRVRGPAIYLLVAALCGPAWAIQIDLAANRGQVETISRNTKQMGFEQSAAPEKSEGPVRQLMQTVSEAFQEQVLTEEQSGFGYNSNALETDSAAMAEIIDERLTKQVKASIDPVYQPVRDSAERLTALMRQLLPDMVDACASGADSWMWLDSYREFHEEHNAAIATAVPGCPLLNVLLPAAARNPANCHMAAHYMWLVGARVVPRADYLKAEGYNCSSARLAPVDLDPSTILEFFTLPRRPGTQNILLIPREGLPASQPEAAGGSSSSSSGADGRDGSCSGGCGSLEAVLPVTDVLLCPEEACVTEWTSDDAAGFGFMGQVLLVPPMPPIDPRWWLLSAPPPIESPSHVLVTLPHGPEARARALEVLDCWHQTLRNLTKPFTVNIMGYSPKWHLPSHLMGDIRHQLHLQRQHRQQQQQALSQQQQLLLERGQAAAAAAGAAAAATAASAAVAGNTESAAGSTPTGSGGHDSLIHYDADDWKGKESSNALYGHGITFRLNPGSSSDESVVAGLDEPLVLPLNGSALLANGTAVLWNGTGESAKGDEGEGGQPKQREVATTGVQPPVKAEQQKDGNSAAEQKRGAGAGSDGAIEGDQGVTKKGANKMQQGQQGQQEGVGGKGGSGTPARDLLGTSDGQIQQQQQEEEEEEEEQKDSKTVAYSKDRKTEKVVKRDLLQRQREEGLIQLAQQQEQEGEKQSVSPAAAAAGTGGGASADSKEDLPLPCSSSRGSSSSSGSFTTPEQHTQQVEQQEQFKRVLAEQEVTPEPSPVWLRFLPGPQGWKPGFSHQQQQQQGCKGDRSSSSGCRQALGMPIAQISWEQLKSPVHLCLGSPDGKGSGGVVVAKKGGGAGVKRKLRLLEGLEREQQQFAQQWEEQQQQEEKEEEEEVVDFGVLSCVEYAMASGAVVLASESSVPPWVRSDPPQEFLHFFSHRPVKEDATEPQEQLQQQRSYPSHHNHHQQQQQRQQKIAAAAAVVATAAAADKAATGAPPIGRRRSLQQHEQQQEGFEEGAEVAAELGLTELGPLEVTLCEKLTEAVGMGAGEVMHLRAEAWHGYAEQRAAAVRAVQRLMDELVVLQRRARRGDPGVVD